MICFPHAYHISDDVTKYVYVTVKISHSRQSNENFKLPENKLLANWLQGPLMVLCVDGDDLGEKRDDEKL